MHFAVVSVRILRCGQSRVLVHAIQELFAEDVWGLVGSLSSVFCSPNAASIMLYLSPTLHIIDCH